MSPAPTSDSLIRSVMQGLQGVLELSAPEESHISLPRFYLRTWAEQLEAALAQLQAPLPEMPLKTGRGWLVLLVVVIVGMLVGLLLLLS